MESILETQAVAEARLFEMISELWQLADELLSKPAQLAPYSENPLEDGIEPEMVS